jgi:hypothetical protein
MKQKGKEIIDVFAMLGLGAMGAVLSSYAVNYTPGLNTASPTMKSIGQLGLGLAGALFIPPKMRYVRYAAMGMAWAGTLGAVERATSIKTLAGPSGNTLSPAEIHALATMGALPGMNGPTTFRRMAGPSTMTPQNGRPSMMGGFRAPT